jgi:hypothetical protein
VKERALTIDAIVVKACLAGENRDSRGNRPGRSGRPAEIGWRRRMCQFPVNPSSVCLVLATSSSSESGALRLVQSCMPTRPMGEGACSARKPAMLGYAAADGGGRPGQERENGNRN